MSVAEDRRGNWIQTASGRRFWPLDPRPDEVHLEDIAHALAHLCRFCGHVRAFYSVAQHSVHVSRLVPPDLALHGLLHDAAEAYAGDVTLPLKLGLRGSTTAYDAIEDALELAIEARFGLRELSTEERAAIKTADRRALSTERRDLMDPGLHWSSLEAHPPDQEPIIALSPTAARALFRWRFYALCPRKTDGTELKWETWQEETALARAAFDPLWNAWWSDARTRHDGYPTNDSGKPATNVMRALEEWHYWRFFRGARCPVLGVDPPEAEITAAATRRHYARWLARKSGASSPEDRRLREAELGGGP